MSLTCDSKKIACFYGKSSIKSKMVTNNFIEFMNTITNMGLESINACLTNIFDIILKQTDKTEYVNIVYLFVNKPEDCNDFGKIYKYRIPNHIILKIIFLDKVIPEICKLKFGYQNVWFFEEQYYHIKPNSFDELSDNLLDEDININNVRSTNMAMVSFPYGIVGQGFIDSLHIQPTWDAFVDNNFMLYKGFTPSIKLKACNYYNTQYLNKSNMEQYDEVEILIRKKHRIEKPNLELYYKHLFDEYKKETEKEKSLAEQLSILQLELKNVTKKIEEYNNEILIKNIKRIKNEQTEFRTQKIEESETFDKLKILEMEIQLNKSKLQILHYHMSDYDDIKKLHTVLIPLIAKFRNYVYAHPDRCKMHCKHITNLCEVFIFKLNDYPIKGERLFFEQMYPSLSLRKTIKYQLQKLLSDITAFSKVKFTGKWLNTLINMKFGKKITKRVNATFDLQNIIKFVNLPLNARLTEIEDIFNYVNNSGLLIRTRQTGASEVEPWNIVVEYVSSDKNTFKNIFISNECCNILRDTKNVRVNNVLLDYTTVDDIMKLCYGYTFTRVPQLYLPSQQLALVTNTWISSLEKIYKIIFMKTIKKIPYDKTKLFNKLEESIMLFNRVQQMARCNEELINIQTQILNSNCTDNTVEKYLSTKNNVVSLTKVLASLTFKNDIFCLILTDKSYYNSNEYHRLCFSLLAEAVIRSCHSKIKYSKSTSEKQIFELLNINIKTSNINKWKLTDDLILKCVGRTNVFFLKQYTNCSLFTVISVMGFLKYYHMGFTNIEIFEQFCNENISTKQFLLDHGKKANGRMTQLALFLYGMKYSDYNKPDDVYFDYPVKIINKITSDYVEIIKTRQKIINNRSEKTHNRLLKRLEIGEQYRIHHNCIPTLFTSSEVEELNKTRIVEDKLILMESGLLKYHCCYSDCPMFLKNLLNNDISPRYALMKHLQFDELFYNRIQGFHKNAKYILKWSKNFDEFIKSMDTMYKKNYNYNCATNIKETLLNIWNKYKLIQ
jgi:hypothetical protein